MHLVLSAYLGPTWARTSRSFQGYFLLPFHYQGATTAQVLERFSGDAWSLYAQSQTSGASAPRTEMPVRHGDECNPSHT